MLFRSDRKSTRLNSSHTIISYAVFCLKKKKTAGGPPVPLGVAAPPASPAPPARAVPRGGAGAVPRRGVADGAGVRDPLLFFFNDTATTEIYTLSLHDALPI